MTVRRAIKEDIPSLDHLLLQVRKVHSDLRPDLFRDGTKKYTDDELYAIITDNNTPIFVYEEDGKILGHAFCVLEDYSNNPAWKAHKTIYIDDICVDETARGKGIAHKLFEKVKEYAILCGCYNITLNVWEGNSPAYNLYKSLGFKVFKEGMEIIL